MPTGGKVLEVNESLKENPSQINKSPFDQGWLIKVELDAATKDQELGKLMTESQYQEFLKSDQH
jgi:glycine cleavage system H protein